MSAILEVTSLCKEYTLGKDRLQPILKQIDLTIGRGEFVSVMGPSGSGKSTLLYVVSGMDRASGGQICFDGKELGTLSEEELAALRLRKMGFVFQQSHLLKTLNVMDNIVLPAYQAKVESRRTINARAQELMERTGIAELAGHDIAQVSGGQLQRAAICRALINQPGMLFADEPTGALHSSAAAEVMHILADIHRAGTSIMLVTHDAKVAARSERVLYMQDGKLIDRLELGRSAHRAEEQKQRESRLAGWLSRLGY